jgi:tRNA 2-thiouridine synthesizing protein A
MANAVVHGYRIAIDTLLHRRPILGSEVKTMTEYDIAETLDVKGENCPMPVVKTKQAVDGLEDGDVLEVLATDSGSMSDLGGWADTTDGVQLLNQEEGDEVYTHYVKVTA